MQTLGYYKIGNCPSHIVFVYSNLLSIPLFVMAVANVQSINQTWEQFPLNAANWYGVLFPHAVTLIGQHNGP